MTFDIVYEENGDIVAEFDTRADAQRALGEIVEEKPHLIGRLGLLPVGADGEPAGDFEPAARLLATA
jgi:hypothetical protein